MIESLPEEATRADLHVPAAVRAGFIDFQEKLVGQSQIAWAEHCSECAYPSCYVDCAFYTPRADFHCRRFVAGIEPIAGERLLHRIRFRKWGKLEGRGPAPLLPMAKVHGHQRRDAAATKLIAATPLPFFAKRGAAFKWNQHKSSLTSPASAVRPDAFAVEAWSSDGAVHPFTLTILNVAETGVPVGGLFQTRFEVNGTYQRVLAPTSAIESQVDLGKPFLVQIEPVGEAEGVQAVFGVCDFVVLETSAIDSPQPTPSAKDAAPAKVVVWDLDETIWQGVLVEDGVSGVRLRPEAALAIKFLDERGVLQTVASKNNEAEALEALRSFGLAEYFLHPQIHWHPKSQSIAAQAKALNLGLDSFVFIDDQAFERAEVTTTLPMVRTLDHQQVSQIEGHPWFDLPVTPESRQRRALYRQEAKRGEALEAAGDNYAAFLRGSDIKLQVDRLSKAELERIYELSQRTNQLNFTGRKYTRDEVQALISPLAKEVGLVLSCADRFGDYGVIGFAVLSLNDGFVKDLFMSCRVQRKRVEHAFLAWLGSEAAAAGLGHLRLAYKPTARNGAALEVLQSLGFSDDGEAAGSWSRVSSMRIGDDDVVAVSAPSLAYAA